MSQNSRKIVSRPCSHENSSFIGAFVKLRKATVSFVTYVRLYVCLVFCPHGIIRLSLVGSAWKMILTTFFENL